MLPPTVLHLLPGGEKGLPAVDGLGESAGQVEEAALPAPLAALHVHAGHLHQLHRALSVSQRLGEV